MGQFQNNVPQYRIAKTLNMSSHDAIKSFRESGEISAHNWDKLLN